MTEPARATAKQSDDPRGWIVVGALFLMLSVVIAGRSSLGLMMPFWKEDMGWSYGDISTAGAVMMVVMAATAPAAGLLIDRYGPRIIYGFGMTLIAVVFILCSYMDAQWQLIAWFSILGGIGFAVISPSLVSATVAQFFDRKIGLATSIATAGSTGGQLALMPLLGFLVVGISWRPSFVVVGSVILATLVVVQLLIRGRPAPGRHAGAKRAAGPVKTVVAGLLRDRTFWLLSGGFFICGFTTVGVVKVHLIPYADLCGFPPLEGTFAYGVLSGFSLTGMLVFGHLADRFNRPVLLASIYFLRALTFILLMNIAGSETTLYLFAILFGLFDYGTFPIVASLVASHIGRHVMGISMGLIFASHSLGGALGTFLGGYLFELFNRYDWVWIVSLGLAVIAGLLSLMIREDRGGAPVPQAA